MTEFGHISNAKVNNCMTNFLVISISVCHRRCIPGVLLFEMNGFFIRRLSKLRQGLWTPSGLHFHIQTGIIDIVQTASRIKKLIKTYKKQNKSFTL